MIPAATELLSLPSERLAFFGLGPDDARLLASLRPVLDASIAPLVEASCAHLLAFEPTAAVFRTGPDRLARFKGALAHYLAGWTAGEFDEAYVASRQAIGDRHQSLGIRPEWCIAMQALWVSSIVDRLFDAAPAAPPLGRAIKALLKIALLDTAIIVERYMDAGFVPRIVLTDAERRAETARDALEAHEAIDRKKDEVLHFLIHDLAAPLQWIAVQSEVSTRTVIDEQTKIQRACGELSALLRNALDAGTLESGQLEARREAIAIDALLAEVSAECHAFAADRGVTLVHACEGRSSGLGDSRLLKRVVTNLVMNAIRHSGTDRVRLEASTRDAWTLVRVIDYGRGIAKSEVEDIFGKFRHGPESAGTGLGLYFCKLAVDAMDGRLGVESRPGFTVFEVALRAPG